MKLFYIFLIVFVLTTCDNKNKSYDKRVKICYEILKTKDIESFFYICTGDSRRIVISEGELKYAHIDVYKRNIDNQLPIMDRRKGLIIHYKLLDSGIYDISITKDSQFKKIPNNELSKYIIFCKKITGIYQEIQPAIITSLPDLGKFIIFQITTKHELIYCPDTSEIPYIKSYSELYSWRKFFRTAEKLDSSWYIRYL